MEFLVHKTKNILMRIKLPGSGKLVKIITLTKIGSFLGKDLKNRFSEKSLLYQFLKLTYIKENPICFLEFGVYRGDSISEWVILNNNPLSEFIGFDTFEGLPENWQKFNGKIKKGEFSTGGLIPEINEPRVRFVKGLFQETLDLFLQSFIDNKLKIIHLDADLYSSTLYVLTRLNNHIKTGDIIIFDEFTSGDEYLAFINFTESYRRRYKILAAAGESSQQVAIEML